jgi:transposase-like protein
MSKRKKYSAGLKQALISEYQAGGCSLYELAKKYGAEYTCARRWWSNYKFLGENTIKKSHANPCYSAELKKQIVAEFLQGSITKKDLAIKYGILAPSTIGTWIKQYNNHEELTRSRPEGVVNMVKGNKTRNTTLKERVEIVSFCLQNDSNYALTAQRYEVTYGQVYQWVNKYRQKGTEGLQDRRGKRKSIEQLTKEEQLEIENHLLKEEIKKKQMELDLLKKVRDIERM